MDELDFGEEYFLHDCGRPYRRDEHWLSFFSRIADHIVREIRPRRVLDAGCAMGLLVEALRERGVEAFGLDLSSYAIARVPAPVREFCWQASITDELDERYDLIVCQEVLPHLPLDDAERAVANFCRHSDDVLFSVMPYPPAPRHANVAPPEHWAAVFAGHAFFRDFGFDGSCITPFAVRYRHTPEAVGEVVRRYEEERYALRRECDSLRTTQADTAAEALRLEHALAATRDQIAHMERSRFWQARHVWRRVRGAVPLRLTGGTRES